MVADDLEVCPADEYPYNIVQLIEDGVPDAESFLMKKEGWITQKQAQ